MPIKNTRDKIILFAFIGGHMLFFFGHGLSHHWGFLSSINDLGHFDQAIWGTVNGHPLLSTDVFNYPINRLGIHFDPVLFLFAPLYKVYPSVFWLTFAQSAALAFAAYPIYLIALHVSGSKKIGVLWGISYLFNPFLISAASWDFHPVSLATLFLAISLLAVVQRRIKLLLFASFMLLICKEHMGVTVAGLGLLYGLHNRQWKTATIFIVLGMASAFIVLVLVMPAYSPTNEHLMISKDSILASRYQWLGTSIGEILETCFTRPFYVIKTLFLEMGGGRYLFSLLVFFLFLPLLAVSFCLPAGADLAANLLSTLSMPRGIFSYHSVTIIPTLAVAAIFGSQKISKHIPFLSLLKSAQYICFFSVGLGFICLPLPFAHNFWKPVQTVNLYDERETVIKKLIEQQSISVQANVGSHFSQRMGLYRFPQQINETEYIVLRLQAPSSKIFQHDIGSLLHHLQMLPDKYLLTIEMLLNNKNFNVAYWDDPWLVFKREPQQTSEKIQMQVLKKIKELRKEWVGSLIYD